MKGDLLSKSTFVRGVQCAKSLYLHKHFPEFRNEQDASLQNTFERGAEVGLLARPLFPDGVDVSPRNEFHLNQSVDLTQQLITQGTPVIYEAAFLHDDVFCSVDILVKNNGKWNAYEVKSTTEVKEEHLTDTSVQYYVLKNSGIRIHDFYVVHLNKTYIRKGELKPRSLFTISSVTEKAKAGQRFVKSKLHALKAMLLSKDIPQVSIGLQCNEPFPCDFTSHCWKSVPENSVFEIAGLSSKRKFDFYGKGIVRMVDVSDDVHLSRVQRLQVDCLKTNNVHINEKEIRDFVSSLHFPLYFMDFESIQPAIPLYNKSRPYQQIVFQYSLHRKRDKSDNLQHSEFLAEAGPDPREMFIQKLLADTAGPGDIVVYNNSFESARLKELARDFPKYASQIRNRLSRIRDLLIPFRKKSYYAPEFRGSYSIKVILPVLVPELSYEKLPVNNGGLASAAFEQLMTETDPAVIDQTRKNLLEYCKLDTLAMVKILDFLRRI